MIGYRCILVVLLVLAGVCHAQESEAEGGGGLYGLRTIVSPLVGWNGTEMTDSDEEYGLFTLVQHPRFVVNNMLFSTEPFGYEVTGDFFFTNVYGSPEDAVTWNLGSGYLWHQIETPATDITVSVPMVKAGMVLRNEQVSLNPYLAYNLGRGRGGGRNGEFRVGPLRALGLVALADGLREDEVLPRGQPRIPASSTTYSAPGSRRSLTIAGESWPATSTWRARWPPRASSWSGRPTRSDLAGYGEGAQ